MLSYQRGVLLLAVSFLFFSCATSPPHSSNYYDEVFVSEYPGSDFAKVDRSVLNLKKDETASIESLVAAIEGMSTTDWEKIRAVYVWIAYNINYDTKSYFQNIDGPTDAAGTFEERRSVCEGYASLFKDMLEKMNIHAVKVSGYGKGYSYREGSVPKGSNHSWNAVETGGAWHLFDVTWGAGYLKGKRYIREFDDFYFDPPPEELIFSHYPGKPEFQLLEKPISREVFFRLPNLKSNFFKTRMKVDDIISRAEKGEVFTTPDIYICKHPYEVETIPITSTLKSGVEYSFIIKSKSARILVSNGAGEPRIFANKDGRFVIKDKFKKGDLVFYISGPGDPNHFSGMFRYKVE